MLLRPIRSAVLFCAFVAPLAGVTVTAKNNDTGEPRGFTTDSSGNYQFNALQPGEAQDRQVFLNPWRPARIEGFADCCPPKDEMPTLRPSGRVEMFGYPA